MVYDKRTIEALQDALDSGVELENMQFPDDKPFKINLANITVELGREPKFNNMKSTALLFSSMSIDSNYISVWKTYALGHFISKDYRKEVHDPETNETPYYIAHYKDGKVNMKVLLRKLADYPQLKMSEADKKKERTTYSDVKINGTAYAIIKIVNTDINHTDWITYEKRTIDIYHDMLGYLEGVAGDTPLYPEDSDE